MNNFKRYTMLGTYIFLLFALFMLFLGDNLIPRRDESYAFIDMVPFLVWAVIFAGHHVLCDRYLRWGDRVVSFQSVCAVLDLIFLGVFLNCPDVRFKDWMMLCVIGLRMGSMLLCLRREKKNEH